MKEISILLVGIGGYGENYVAALLPDIQDERLKGIRIAGIVDPYPEKCSLISKITERNIPVYHTLEAFYKNGFVDLAIICTPIHLHVEQILFCLTKGSNVLCEKPLCATYQDSLRLLEAERNFGKMVGIGFQLSFSNAVQEMKQDINSGVFGKPIQLKAFLLMPRGEQYYKRNNWAGRIKANNGSWVLDSPVNNACAHQLHNMLYVLGKTRETSANPVSITAELYRAYSMIENYDTAALRCMTEDGVEILFYTSLAVRGKTKSGPISRYSFEKATIFHDQGDDENFWVRFHDGAEKYYREAPKSDRLQKLWDAIAAVREGKQMACGISASTPHLLCVNGAQESMPEIGSLPESFLAVEGPPGDSKTYIMGIEITLMDCFVQAKLPNELGVPWSNPGKRIDLRNYRGFYGI